ncbi:MAG: AfsR/SARP family transcriptional regulator [Microthrixaceae bacterium]|nr:AfsR/SARP family transcriptional regulator [Microthrixaceae bacterium]
MAAATIVDDVWGGDAPDRALHSLQQHLSEFRKVLAAPEVLVTREPGYLLVVSRLDADRFEELARAGADAASEGRHADALAHWDEAIGCWSGPVLADVAESPAIRATATRLHELRAVVQEDRVEALLSLGRERDAVVQLDSLVGEHPFRERLRGQQMLALYRSGRQSDALTAYRDAREVLVEGLGIEPPRGAARARTPDPRTERSPGPGRRSCRACRCGLGDVPRRWRARRQARVARWPGRRAGGRHGRGRP